MKALRLFAVLLLAALAVQAADHNDPNAINAIFTGNPASGADLYDMFGYPADDKSGGEKVVMALTFADAPYTGKLDTDILYRILVYPSERPVKPAGWDSSVKSYLDYLKAQKQRFDTWKAAEIRVASNDKDQAKLTFVGFAGGNFSAIVPLNVSVAANAPGNDKIKIYVGGRDDAFFNDLPGFFRSINYGPEFYQVQLSDDPGLREMPIPKTLLALEGNALFNDPPDPALVDPKKPPLPPGPYGWKGNRYYKDANGNYRFVYSGKDARAGLNVNAIIVEMPLSFITKSPQSQRIVNV